MACVDLEKAFDQVPQKVIWWALRKLGVEEWTVRLVQGMYANAWSHVRVFFFLDLGFTALSRIFHLYRADRSSKVGENRRTRRKTT